MAKSTVKVVTLEERATGYSAAFPKYPPLMVAGGWLYGVWMIGNNYKSRTGFYGEYPASYLDRIHSLFPDAQRVLHLFSGAVDVGRWPEEVRIDVVPTTKPDVLCNLEDSSWPKKALFFGHKGKYNLALADPPYSNEDSIRYGVPLVKRNAVVKLTASVLRSGGHLVWLDQVYPMWTKRDWKAVGTIGLWRSTNHRFRGVTILERK